MTDEIDASATISYKADDATVNVRFVDLFNIKESLEKIVEDVIFISD